MALTADRERAFDLTPVARPVKAAGPSTSEKAASKKVSLNFNVHDEVKSALKLAAAKANVPQGDLVEFAVLGLLVERGEIEQAKADELRGELKFAG